MMEWWSNLTAANQVFYVAAIFFSAFFVWQFMAALFGLGGGEGEADVDAGADVDADVDVDVDVDMDDIEAGSAGDAMESMASFHLISIRSILAFFMMFSWAGALYLNNKLPLGRSITYAVLWGAAGMIAAAGVVYMIRRLAETGTPRLATAVGTTGTVYMQIPAQGQGKVRVAVSGAISYVSARGRGGAEISAGTPVRVLRKAGPNILEVEPLENTPQRKDDER